ncbi:MAG: A24 family peptidase [Lachnospiraceae bacterium]
MWSISQIYMVGFLAGCGLIDVMYKKIPTVLLIAGSIGVAILRILQFDGQWWLYMAGGILGVGFLILSKYSGEALGYGDSWLILLLGIGVGLWELITLLMLAFFCSGVVAIGGMIGGNWSRKHVLPFVPFLTLGYVGVLLL